MNRRDILKFGIASSLLFTVNFNKSYSNSNNTLSKIKPKALISGDKIAIVSPSTNVTDPLDIFRAKEICNKLELEAVFINDDVKYLQGYKTRSADIRLKELHNAFSDDMIKGIFCIRGGYGSAALLDKLDYDLIKNNPKVFAGYSDITALHLGIHQNTGLITFHSPMALSDFSGPTFEYFKKAVFENEAIGEIKNPTSGDIREKYPVLTISEGKAEGELSGGNLSLITSLMGTPYEIETKDKILFIEDVGEAPYSIDRMLTQLRLSGKLDEVRGVVIGKCESCGPSGTQSSLWDRSELEVYHHFFENSNYPVIYGLMIGHTDLQFTLPIGVKAELNTNSRSLNILESAVN